MTQAESVPLLEVHRRPVGAWHTNAYVLREPTSRHSILVDPGSEPAALQALLADSIPQAILITHTHADHIGALPAMRRALGVPVYAHPLARARIIADQWLNDGDTLPLGAVTLRLRAAPGHSPDMLMCLADDPATGGLTAIVGDTIFDGGPGRTWSAADFRTTLATLRDVVLPLPDATHCYPGHGESFRLGDIRAAIQAFVERDHGDFYGNATWA
ncbi:MAG: MBL fold metallo-hydrolase [Chloroflexaceae bacterium]|nr:MBL fold metallo-hydrolase [Chloroflexaceae bacterium]